jgi:hypothetical protein
MVQEMRQQRLEPREAARRKRTAPRELFDLATSLVIKQAVKLCKHTMQRELANQYHACILCCKSCTKPASPTVSLLATRPVISSCGPKKRAAVSSMPGSDLQQQQQQGQQQGQGQLFCHDRQAGDMTRAGNGDASQRGNMLKQHQHQRQQNTCIS